MQSVSVEISSFVLKYIARYRRTGHGDMYISAPCGLQWLLLQYCPGDPQPMNSVTPVSAAPQQPSALGWRTAWDACAMSHSIIATILPARPPYPLTTSRQAENQRTDRSNQPSSRTASLPDDSRLINRIDQPAPTFPQKTIPNTSSVWVTSGVCVGLVVIF